MHYAIMLNADCDNLSIEAKVFSNGVDGLPVNYRGSLLRLSGVPDVKLELSACEINDGTCGLCSNEHGSYTIARGAWGQIKSKYDAFLAANLNGDVPDTQIAALLRFKGWVRYLDYSTELELACQESFVVSYDNALAWTFIVGGEAGVSLKIKVVWQLDNAKNAGRLSAELLEAVGVDKNEPVLLILRPDIDCRSIHSITQAFRGQETQFRDAVQPIQNGILFNGMLRLQWSQGGSAACIEPLWSYQVPLPVEQERGLDWATDLFSPGFFQTELSLHKPVALDVGVNGDCFDGKNATFERLMPLEKALSRGVGKFIVRRNEYKSVIAGYPWFLDWGRDTLICLRGIIADGNLAVAHDLICQFASFEQNGTLPNMIRGNDTSDRDTSDAPLWLFVAVQDYIAKTGKNDILSEKCGSRTLENVLCDLLEGLWNGAPNGVRADQSSGLLYSPSHFTWMDTNYPAGTPRCGYPVEIEALWINAMAFVSQIMPDVWKTRLMIATDNFTRLFVRSEGYLADCLHADSFIPAENAVADDAVRPNQLLAITLHVIKDKAIMAGIIRSAEPLLVPGAIRSLDDAPVSYPLAIFDNGRALNDPSHPFWGHYSGDEDSRRKPAYHNGTAWGWQMPLFAEALCCLYGNDALPKAKALLSAAALVMSNGCVGFLPEICDGYAPHTRKGCVAQAWSMTECLRVIASWEK